MLADAPSCQETTGRRYLDGYSILTERPVPQAFAASLPPSRQGSGRVRAYGNIQSRGKFPFTPRVMIRNGRTHYDETKKNTCWQYRVQTRFALLREGTESLAMNARSTGTGAEEDMGGGKLGALSLFFFSFSFLSFSLIFFYFSLIFQTLWREAST